VLFFVPVLLVVLSTDTTRMVVVMQAMKEETAQIFVGNQDICSLELKRFRPDFAHIAGRATSKLLLVVSRDALSENAIFTITLSVSHYHHFSSNPITSSPRAISLGILIFYSWGAYPIGDSDAMQKHDPNALEGGILSDVCTER
jgi:hypothetical protein